LLLIKKKNLAVRFPNHKVFKNLLKKLEYPLAAPSANISNRLSSVEASDVREEFGSKIKYILNGGKCSIGLESTIINLTNKPTILRLGGIDISKIRKILNTKIFIKINSRKKIAPGQSHLHYSPGIPLKMNIRKPQKDAAFVLIKKRKKDLKNFYYLSKKNNLNEAAKNLYSCLRKIKNKGYKSIAIEKIPNKGLGKAINDKLSRASKY
jgi:L-threonylcarbamoyladenylate synthase